MEKYKGKYRSESNRLRGWDYSSDGQYFITINTYDRACLFGDIMNGKMILNDFGKIATGEWFKSFEIRQELFLNEFILMPNHLHAIVGLKSERVVTNEHGVNDMESNGTPVLESNGTNDIGPTNPVIPTITIPKRPIIPTESIIPNRPNIPNRPIVPTNPVIPTESNIPKRSNIPKQSNIPNNFIWRSISRKNLSIPTIRTKTKIHFILCGRV